MNAPIDSLIVLEFNELSPQLMKRFMEQGRLPNFQRLYRESDAFVTEADEQAPYLEPWIQWVTVHCGLPFAEHRIENLDEGHKVKEKSIWDLVSDAGRRVWVCGSMNIHYRQPINGCVLPDPWSTTVAPTPAWFQPYFRFVHEHVLEYATQRVPLTAMDQVRFLKFMVAHGLSGTTARATLQQLFAERFNRRAKWKRAAILDRLQFDVFRAIYRRERPQLATFFLNSTAHFQHLYWRNLDPQLFKVQSAPDEQNEYEDAIAYGYEQMDRIVGEADALCDDRTALVFCTALSQQPCLTYEERGGKKIYRPRDFERLLAFAGVTAPHRVVPVMSQEFRVYLEGEAEAKDAEEKLLSVHIGEDRMLNVERNGREIQAGSCVIRDIGQDEELRRDGVRDRFYDVFVLLEGLKSGMHHPDGLFWVRRPERQGVVHADKVPLVSVAPTLLNLISVPVPSTMRGPVLLDGKRPRRAVG